MKTDIFEDMKERVGCENISDLPYRKRMVWEIIKQHSPLDYPKEQLVCPVAVRGDSLWGAAAL